VKSRFAPGALAAQGQTQQLRLVFRAEGDWRRAEVEAGQHRVARRDRRLALASIRRRF